MVAEPNLPRRRFTVDQYHRMIRAGILREGERVELIEGEIIEMAAVGNRHIACILDLDELFQVGLAGRARVSVQNPVQLSASSEPEPDLTILRHRPDRYRSGPPLAEDVYLLIEVSDTTLAYDRGIKLRLYALAGVPEYWIFDLKRNRLLVFREPEGAVYFTPRGANRGCGSARGLPRRGPGLGRRIQLRHAPSPVATARPVGPRGFHPKLGDGSRLVAFGEPASVSAQAASQCSPQSYPRV